MIPFESLGTVSYSFSIVTMVVSLAISDIQRQKMVWSWNVGLGSFKVIENGAVRQTMNDFLLARHCNYSSILYRMRIIWRWINIVILKSGLEVTPVIETGTIQKLGCSFLFAFYSNYGRICSRLWDI